jgi:hypothetical protein
MSLDVVFAGSFLGVRWLDIALFIWSAAIYRRFGFRRELIPGGESDNELSHSKFLSKCVFSSGNV